MNPEYLNELYSLLVKHDPTYESDIPFDLFKEKMGNPEYASKINDWVKNAYPSFEIQSDKKKADPFGVSSFLEPQVEEQQPMVMRPEEPTESLSEDGSLAQSVLGKTANRNKDLESLRQYEQPQEEKPEVAAVGREDYLKQPMQEIEQKAEFDVKMKDIEEKTPEFIKTALKSSEISQRDKYITNYVTDLNYNLGTAGFKFEQKGSYIKMTAPDGTIETIQYHYADKEDAKAEIDYFVRTKSSDLKNVDELEKLYKGEERKFATDMHLDFAVKELSNEQDDIISKAKQYLKEKNDAEKTLQIINSMPEDERPSDYRNLKFQAEESLKRIYNDGIELQNKINMSEAKKKNLELAAGKYIEKQEKQGSWVGGFYNSTLDGIGKTIAGLTDVSIDIGTGAPISWYMDEAELRDKRAEKLKDMGLNPDEIKKALSVGAVEDVKSKVIGDPMDIKFDRMAEGVESAENRKYRLLLNDADEAIRNEIRKDTKYGTPEEITFMEGIRTAFREVLGDKNTSEQWMALTKQGFIGGAILGVGESLPTMFVPGGAIARKVAMYGYVNDNVNQEFENNPNLANISESEKLLVKVPIGIVGAVLEEIGLSSILKNTGITNAITGRVLSKVAKGMTPIAIKEIAETEIGKMVSDGLIRVVGGGLAEFETGLLQQGNDITVKSIYNTVKEKDLFNTPETIPDLVIDLIKAGGQEMVGSMVITTPMAVAKAYSTDNIAGIPREYFDIFVESSKDENVQKLFVASLKQQVASGKITNKEAVDLLNNYRRSAGLLRSMPEELDNAGKQKAMVLMKEREKLQSKLEGKDEALAKPIKDRINSINEQLTKLTEDAIQKQETGEVPVQPEAGVSEEVEGGKPETELEVTTREGLTTEEIKREEVLRTAIEANPDAETVTVDGIEMPINEAMDEMANLQSKATQESEIEAEVAPKTTTDILKSVAPEAKETIIVKDKDGNDVALNGNEEVVNNLYEEAIATPEDQRTQDQNDVIEKVQRIISQVAAETEVTPTLEQQTAPAEPAQTFTEQDKARQQELTDALAKADKRRKNITVGETIMPKADVKAELDALNQKELSSQQPVTKLVQKLTPEQEAAELEKLFNAPRSEKPTSKAKSKKEKNLIRNTILNAAKAIAKVLPKVNIVVHETIDDYINATGDTEASSGLYVPSADGGTIHINLENSNRRTAGHEVFHAILLRGIKTDAEAQRLAKAMLNAVMKSLNQSGNNQELLGKIQEFVSNYDENIQNEESLAEIFGYLADGYPSLDAPTKNIIQRFLDRIAKLFGLKSMNDKDIIDFMNTIAKKVATGEEITESDFIGGKKVSSPSDGLTTRKRIKTKNVNLEVRYFEQERMDQLIKDKLVVEVDDLSSLNGMHVVTTSPDDMLVGSIYVNGKEVAVGNGGIFFVTKFGDVWANSNEGTTNGLEKALNEAYEKNPNGKTYLVLVKGSDAKLVSSPQGVTSSLAVTEAMLDAGLFSLSDFRDAIKFAVKKHGGSISLNPKGSAKQLKNELDDFFKDVTSSTFKKRGNVLREIIGQLAQSKSAKENKKEIIEFLKGDTSKNIGATVTPNQQSLVDLIAKVSAEELTKGLSTGDIYGVVEISGRVKVFKDQHQSYPYHIKMVDENGNISSKKPVLILPKNRKNGKEILTDVDGKTASELGTGFPGKVGATANLPYGKGIIQDTRLTPRQQKVNKEVQGIEQLPSSRKQIIGKNANLAQDVRDNLQVARNMETAGKDAKTIRITTGWEKGKDNKWRYEILDGDLKGEIGNFKGNLSDVLENKELFNAYPELAKLEVDLRLNGLDEGIYEFGKQKIKINGSKGTMLSILLHEVQHAIQSIEGFAKGGNIEMMKTPNDILVNLINQLPSKTLTREERSLIKDEYEKNGLKRLPILPTSSDITSGDIYVIEDFIDKLDILIELFPNETSYKNLQDFLDLKLLDISGIEKDVETAFEKYQKIAGEVEARNVQKRMKMTPEQRRQTTLQETEDVAREDQVIFFYTNLSPRQQKAKKELKDIIKTARANGYSDEGIRIYLKKIGLEDADIDTLLQEEKGVGKKITLSEETLPGYDNLMSKIKAFINRSRRRGVDEEKAMENVINNLEKSPEYEKATDQQKEQLIRDIREMFGKKEKKAPTANKILGKPKPETQTKTVNALRKEFWAAWNRSAREAKADLNTKRKMLSAAIKDMEKSGKISAKQAEVLIKRVNAVNLDNPDMVQRVLDYAEKVFKDAEYAEKLTKANSLASAIKSIAKSKAKLGDLKNLAKEFAKIDPSLVEDIDTYIEMAQMVKSGVGGSKLTPGGVKISEGVRIDETMEYINDAIDNQSVKLEEMAKAKLIALAQENSNLTEQEVIEMLELGTDPDTLDIKKKEFIRKVINNVFNAYRGIVENMLKTNTDPNTGDPIDIKASDKKLVEAFMDMDLNELSPKDALAAIDALTNFMNNGSTANMGNTMARYNGKQNAKIAADLARNGKLKSHPIKMWFNKLLGKNFYEQFASIPLMFEKIFKGGEKGAKVMELAGITSLINHKAEAVSFVNNVVKEYATKFSGLKPNKKAFNSLYNIVERGIISNLSRSVIGSEEVVRAEFERRKDLIMESIDILRDGTKREQEMADAMEEAYNNIARDAESIDDVRAAADNINVDAVKFWVDKWASIYPELADVALNIYNKVLDNDINYTPDRYSFLEGSGESNKPVDSFESTFFGNSNKEYLPKKEAKSLMDASGPESLYKTKDGEKTSDMYVNLSFDSLNANAMLEAMIDIKTAADIRQIQEFKDSSSFKSLIPDKVTRNMVQGRIKLLVENIKNKKIVVDKEFGNFLRMFDKFSKFGASLALAGPFQIPKQTLSVMINTVINGGPIRISSAFRSDVNNFINNSGRAIANRGIDAITEIETLNEKMTKEAAGAVGKTIRAIERINDRYLKIFLSNPDVFVARASWITYYEKSLREQGVKGKIDYSTHELNEKAADYAQRMVDKQQNISDRDLAGFMQAGGNPWKTLFLKVAMPFSTFRINQTTRLMNDFTTFTSKTASKKDRAEAAWSLGGTLAEMATFRALSFGLAWGLYELSQAIVGDEEDEEKRQRKFDNMMKGAASSSFADLFSPVPLTDDAVKIAFNTIASQFQSLADISEEDQYQLFTGTFESFSSSYGMLGISLDKAYNFYQDAKLAYTGKFKDDWGNEKFISSDYQELLQKMLLVRLATDSGILPSPEAGTVARNIVKMAKSNARTAKQLQKEDAYNGYNTLEEFKENDMKGYLESAKPGGALYEMRESKEEGSGKRLWEKDNEAYERKLKKDNPRKWREMYGPGTEYYKYKRSPQGRAEAREKLKEKERKKKEKVRKEKEERIKRRKEKYGQ